MALLLGLVKGGATDPRGRVVEGGPGSGVASSQTKPVNPRPGPATMRRARRAVSSSHIVFDIVTSSLVAGALVVVLTRARTGQPKYARGADRVPRWPPTPAAATTTKPASRSKGRSLR